MDGTTTIGVGALLQCWAHVACRGSGRFQRRRQVRYFLAERATAGRRSGPWTAPRSPLERPCPMSDLAGMSLRAADFNGDGKSDILWQNERRQAGDLDHGRHHDHRWNVPARCRAWLACRCSGRFQRRRQVRHSLAERQTARRRSGPWTAPRSPLERVLPDPGPAWHVAAAADFNGDGKSDILWQHDSGLPAIWTMDGTNITAGTYLPNPGSDWHLF